MVGLPIAGNSLRPVAAYCGMTDALNTWLWRLLDGLKTMLLHV